MVWIIFATRQLLKKKKKKRKTTILGNLGFWLCGDIKCGKCRYRRYWSPLFTFLGCSSKDSGNGDGFIYDVVLPSWRDIKTCRWFLVILEFAMIGKLCWLQRLIVKVLLTVCSSVLFVTYSSSCKINGWVRMIWNWHVAWWFCWYLRIIVTV